MIPFAAEDVLSSILLCAVVLLVLAGNSLVVAAVATSKKLRTVTNVFIVNLACADLLLGVLVLPFSAVLEIKDVWIFGRLWCQVWLAVDVWLCTASILNLCCISLDRYLAITRPIRYPGLMSSRRAKTLVAGVWLFSFIIGCPPLIGWNDSSEKNGDHTNSSTLFPAFSTSSPISLESGHECGMGFNSSTNSSVNASCSSSDTVLVLFTTCELTNTRGYRIYAALGSFFIPMLVMVFFYLQIYRAAVRTISAYEKGELKTKFSSREKSNGSRKNSVTLRIHRGGRGFSSGGSGCGSSCRGGHPATTTVLKTAPRDGCNSKEGVEHRLGKADGVGAYSSIRKDRSSDASLVTLADLQNETVGNGNTNCSPAPESLKQNKNKSHWWSKDKKEQECKFNGQQFFKNQNHNGKGAVRTKRCSARCLSMPMDSEESTCGSGSSRNSHQKIQSHSSMPLSPSASSQTVESGIVFIRGSSTIDHKTRRSRFSVQRPGNAMKLHMQKFNREKKAAKTLAVIVGAFILCWMPFFTIYLVGAFCENCISPIIFSVAFWLGYCNSAMNPCVYALFSRDFRSAFRTLLTCRCKTWRRNPSFKPNASDIPAIQLQCVPQDDARSSSDLDGHWR